MSAAGFIVVATARYLALVFGAVAIIGSLSISVRYGRIAFRYGLGQALRDIKTYQLTALLPIHVAAVSFATAGLVAGDCAEILVRFEKASTWRLVYLPLNFLVAFSIVLISLFVKHRGERVVPIPPDNTLIDRTSAAELLAQKVKEDNETLLAMHSRREAQDARTERQDRRDEHQDERTAAQNERGSAQNDRSTAQNERDEAYPPRLDGDKRDIEQDARDTRQNDRGTAQNQRGTAQNQRDTDRGEQAATADETSATNDDVNTP